MKCGISIGLLALIAGPAHAASENWSSTVTRIISTRQQYPRSAALRGEQGTTRIRLLVAPDGRISRLVLEKSSGSTILDNEAQTTIRAIGKLPPPPEGTTSLLVPITWRLD